MTTAVFFFHVPSSYSSRHSHSVLYDITYHLSLNFGSSVRLARCRLAFPVWHSNSSLFRGAIDRGSSGTIRPPTPTFIHTSTALQSHGRPEPDRSQALCQRLIGAPALSAALLVCTPAELRTSVLPALAHRSTPSPVPAAVAIRPTRQHT